MLHGNKFKIFYAKYGPPDKNFYNFIVFIYTGIYYNIIFTDTV